MRSWLTLARTKVVEESTPDANESPCSVSRPVAPPAAANQSTDKIESTSVSGLTAPPAVSKQFTNSQKEGESVADPIESASFVSGLVAPPPAAKQLTRSQMEGKSTPDPQEPPSMHSSSFVPPTPEKKLTDKQKEAIKNLFEQDTKNKTDFTLKYVRNKCCTSSVLGQLALQKRVKQVINHINYLKSKQDTKSPDKLPTTSAGSSKVNTWLDDFDDPSTRSFGKRGVWDDEETELLEKRFHQDTLPSTTIIRETLNSDDQLFTILNREGWKRTYTKKHFQKKIQESIWPLVLKSCRHCGMQVCFRIQEH